MDQILLGKGDGSSVSLLVKYANRHGLVTGATGTGKTVSLMLLAEGFSRHGIPVFMADVKGDVAGMAMPGTDNAKIQQRLSQLAISDYLFEANPVIFWDLYGAAGHPIRATISQIGPVLLGRMLALNDTQAGTLEILFTFADEQNLLLLDLDDLRTLLVFAAENRQEISSRYGLVSTQTISVIQRALLTFEREGGATMLGEPALELNDLMRRDLNGRGVVNILSADRLILHPRLYSTFLLWLLSELFEKLPESGDLEKPRLAFFFDEAHLLFSDVSPALRKKVEQVVRLIRSKGVGIYFCSQFPDDIPGEILGQLGNRVQHALRAYTPRDQKAVKTAAETFAANPKIDIVSRISQLGVGEALVSTLQEKGVPSPVEEILVAPPRSRIGTIQEEERKMVLNRSPIAGKYDTRINRESAHELLSKSPSSSSSERRPGEDARSVKDTLNEFMWGTKRRQGMVETLAKQTMRTIGSHVGREIGKQVKGKVFRGILGSISGDPPKKK